MVSLFDKASQATKGVNNKIMAIGHQEFLKRIKKTLYYGPSNPNRMISYPLAQHVTSHFNETHRNYDLNVLDLKTVSRIKQQTPCSLILSLIYLERLIKADPHYARIISPSELFLITLMVSAKFYTDYDESDVFANNFAYEGEITLKRLKQLEISFLNAIQWNLLVSEEEFYLKLKTVEKLVALREGGSRKGNSFTYTEMQLLMPSLELAQLILHHIAVLVFVYVCSVATIVVSGIILTSVPMKVSIANTTTHDVPENITHAIITSVANGIDDAECADRLLVNDFSMDESIITHNFTIHSALLNYLEFETKTDYVNFLFGALGKLDNVHFNW